MYDEYVYLPFTPEEIQALCMHAAGCGFPGNCAYMDGTHVAYLCACSQKVNSTGKAGYPTRNYNFISDHHLRCLGAYLG